MNNISFVLNASVPFGYTSLADYFLLQYQMSVYYHTDKSNKDGQ